MTKGQEQHDHMDKIVSLAKRRGFIYQGSEIYGGLAGTWDWGPLGVALKNNVKNLWWRMFVEEREDMYGVDAAILMNPKVWESSGHVAGFSDPLVACKNCKTKHRVDQIPGFSQKDYSTVQKEIEIRFQEPIKSIFKEVQKIFSTVDEKHIRVKSLMDFIDKEPLSEEQKNVFRDTIKKILDECAEKLKQSASNIKIIEVIKNVLEDSNRYTGYVTQEYLNRFLPCPVCGTRRSWDIPSSFNMMFQTQIGATEGSISYLRPETAQGIFVNFKNIVDSFHPKLPFGIGQIGKAFRNEIAPRDFIFRVRELEQMEVEYFVRPQEWEKYFEMWRETMWRWMDAVGINRSHVHEHEIPDVERAHYSKRTIDFEFDYPFGRKELYGLAYRTDFDLQSHARGSGVSQEYLDEKAKEKFVPHVIEPSLGVDRTILAILLDAYSEDEMGEGKRVFLKLKPSIAPVKVAVFPLLKNKPELVKKAREVYGMMKKEIPQTMWDDNGNVGKRYRRQDEIGTPYCITVDFETLDNGTATVRDRDTGKQERIPIENLASFLKEKLA